MTMDKATRVLILFYNLIQGKSVNKHTFIEKYELNKRSFERDIKTLRNFLMEMHIASEIVFDRRENTYYLSSWENNKFTSVEVITLLKILLGTRALNKKEMQMVVNSIKSVLNPKEKKELLFALYDEMENYIPPIHSKALLENIGYINNLIYQRCKIQIKYIKANGKVIQRDIIPVAFVFSDFYFYLIAFINDIKYDYPAFFRIDRIKDIKDLNEKYDEKLYQQYNTGSMRNCLQFMYAGKLLTVKIRCKNCAVEAMRDRLPNNWLVKDEGNYKIYKAKVFGEGFIKWVLSQGNNIEILEPIEMRNKLIEKIKVLSNLYMSI